MSERTHESDTARAGIVLAGGHSRRFGERDKALASLAGVPMLVRVVRRVDAAVDRVLVSCREAQRTAFADVLASAGLAAELVTDPEPGVGPFGGLCESAPHVDTPYVAVVACDMPGVDPAFLDELFAVASGRDGAVPLDDEGIPQPTQAVYRTGALHALCREEGAGISRGLNPALDDLDVRYLPPDAVAAVTRLCSLTNVNTRAELAAFEGSAESGSPE